MGEKEDKEKIIYKCEPHKIKIAVFILFSGMFLFSGFVTLIPSILVVFMVFKLESIAGPIFCILVGTGIWKFANYCLSTEQLILTNRRIYGKTGIVTKKTLSTPIQKIQAVKIRKTLGGKMFGYSDLEIHCVTSVYWFTKQKNAEGMQKAIFDIMDKLNTKEER